MAIILRENSSRGQQIIARSKYSKGTTLRQVYGSWSQAKEDAFNKCYERYATTPEAHSFHICSANTWGFSVSWYGMYEGQDALFYETKDNSYVVLFNVVLS